MRVVFFDVSNGNCAIVVGKNGNSIMMDCGSHGEKLCPVDGILKLKATGQWLEHMQDFERYPLTKLVVSHPDIDHLRNSEKVYLHLRPKMLHRRKLGDYPTQLLATNDDSFKAYKSNFCDVYTSPITNHPNWAFQSKSFQIPFEQLNDEGQFGMSSYKNNSSLVYVLEYAGSRIMFCGDMETAGWDWLLKNDSAFVKEVSNGIDILVASHHGHQSGYSNDLMSVIGSPPLTIISKGSETGGETKVASQYSANSTGMNVKNLNSSSTEIKYSVSTRANGGIYINFNDDGSINAYSDK